MKRAEVLAISFLAAFLGLAGSAFAQGTPSARPDKGAEKAAPQYPASAPESDDTSVRAPVLKVIGVEVMRSAHAPALDIVRVWGVSSTDAWEEPELVPLTHTPSGDGVLELLFVARSPAEAMDPTPFGTLDAIFVIDSGHPYKAIRVRGASNSVLLNKMPGYVEAAAPKQDCTKCVGKYFVGKGAASPAGIGSGDLVKEEDLGASVRVIKASEGVAKLDMDPNRLTLVVGDNGKIELAIWD